MTDDPQFILWLEAEPELWPALITARHDQLAANFNGYVVSEAVMEKCARIQRNVNACWVRDGYGLLRTGDAYVASAVHKEWQLAMLRIGYGNHHVY